MLPKCCLRKTIRQVEETAGFVIFSNYWIVFSKCCLREPSGPCRTTEKYERTPEQACDDRQSAPVQCKDNTFFAEIQIAKFRVNISRTTMEAEASPPTPPLKGRGEKKNREPACLVSFLLAQRRGRILFSPPLPFRRGVGGEAQFFSDSGDRFADKNLSLYKIGCGSEVQNTKTMFLALHFSRLALSLHSIDVGSPRLSLPLNILSKP